MDLLARITEALAPVPGVAAIVLGGSRAVGTHHPRKAPHRDLRPVPAAAPPAETGDPPSRPLSNANRRGELHGAAAAVETQQCRSTPSGAED